LETDSIFTLYAHVCSAGLFSIVPHSMLSQFELHHDVAALPLMPDLSREVGLTIRRQDLLSPYRLLPGT